MSQLENIMKALGVTEDEARQILAEDAEVDKMSMTEVASDMTAEQVEASKKARQADRKPTVYKFETTKKTRPANENKRFLIDTLRTALELAGADDLNVTNIEREIEFLLNGVKFKLTLSQPRK